MVSIFMPFVRFFYNEGFDSFLLIDPKHIDVILSFDEVIGTWGWYLVSFCYQIEKLDFIFLVLLSR